MKNSGNEAGFILFPLLFLMLSLPLLLVFSGDVITQAKNISANMQTDQTIMRMGMLKMTIIRYSEDVDEDTFIEPLSPVDDGSGKGRMPLKMNLVTKDGWGRDFDYCTWDLGILNTVDPQYSNNNSLPYLNGQVARLISSGEDGIFQTPACDSPTGGDDLAENIFNSDIRSYSR